MNVAGYLAGDCKTISHLPIRRVCDIAALPDASRIEVMGTVIYPAIPPVIARAGFCLRVPSRTSRYPVDVTSGCPFWRRLHGYRTPRKYLLLLAPLRVRATHNPPDPLRGASCTSPAGTSGDSDYPHHPRYLGEPPGLQSRRFRGARRPSSAGSIRSGTSQILVQLKRHPCADSTAHPPQSRRIFYYR